MNNDGMLATAHQGNSVVNELQKDRLLHPQPTKPLAIPATSSETRSTMRIYDAP